MTYQDSIWGTPVVPMEPQQAKRLRPGERFINEVKWDGIRLLTHIRSGDVRIFTRRGNRRDQQYPEVRALERVFGGHSAIVDGEAVVIRGGRPDFFAVLARDRGQSLSKPVTYFIFDLLFLDGEDLRQRPWHRRRQLLETHLSPEHLSDIASLQLSRTYTNAAALWASVKQLELEGIIQKNRFASYRPGKGHAQWFKRKLRRISPLAVGGLRIEKDEVSSLLVGGWDQDRLRYLGRVGSGLNQPTRSQLYRLRPRLRRAETPFDPPVPPEHGKHAVWVKPLLTIRVSYAGWTPDGRLRQPVFKGFIRADERPPLPGSCPQRVRG